MVRLISNPWLILLAVVRLLAGGRRSDPDSSSREDAAAVARDFSSEPSRKWGISAKIRGTYLYYILMKLTATESHRWRNRIVAHLRQPKIKMNFNFTWPISNWLTSYRGCSPSSNYSIDSNYNKEIIGFGNGSADVLRRTNDGFVYLQDNITDLQTCFFSCWAWLNLQHMGSMLTCRFPFFDRLF